MIVYIKQNKWIENDKFNNLIILIDKAGGGDDQWLAHFQPHLC